MLAHQTIAKFGPGEPFERRPRQKAGFWTNNAHDCSKFVPAASDQVARAILII